MKAFFKILYVTKHKNYKNTKCSSFYAFEKDKEFQSIK